MPVSFDEIERLKRLWTDRRVRIGSERPELARFRPYEGRVVTITMNGRALVEWLDSPGDIGWHDLDLDDLVALDAPAEPPRD